MFYGRQQRYAKNIGFVWGWFVAFQSMGIVQLILVLCNSSPASCLATEHAFVCLYLDPAFVAGGEWTHVTSVAGVQSVGGAVGGRPAGRLPAALSRRPRPAAG